MGEKEKAVIELLGERFQYKEAVIDMAKDAEELIRICVGIGGPLNDNCKGYNKEQWKDWKQVLDLAERIYSEAQELGLVDDD